MASRGKGISTRWKLGMVHFSSYDAAASLNHHLSCYLFFSTNAGNDSDDDIDCDDDDDDLQRRSCDSDDDDEGMDIIPRNW